MHGLLRHRGRMVLALAVIVVLVTGGALGFLASHRGGGVANRPSPSPSTTAVSAPPETPSPAGTPTPSPAGTPTAAPTQARTPAPTPACVDPAAWPVARRLAQLIIAGGQFSSLAASGSAASTGVGGFVFFGQPAAGSGPAIASGIAGLAATAAASGQVTPWMSTDEEGGLVQRLANVTGALPAPRQMAAQWTPAQVQATIASHASAMRSLGITMDLAPVLDIAAPDNPYADESDRSFSENPTVAAAYGTAFATGLASAGVLPTAKHFPGIGHADGDTDRGPATDPPLSQLQTADLIPFQKAIAGGAQVVMVSHAAVPGLTGTIPASLSPATYRYLRQTLGFVGIAMTDSLGAGAISAAGYSQPAAAVAAVEAGADMVMVDAASWPATLAALEQAASTGALPQATANAAVRRILVAKGVRVCGS